MDYWIIVISFLVALGWQIIARAREQRQTNRWIRTRVGPGLGIDSEQTEELIESYEQAENERRTFRAGRWVA